MPCNRRGPPERRQRPRTMQSSRESKSPRAVLDVPDVLRPCARRVMARPEELAAFAHMPTCKGVGRIILRGHGYFCEEIHHAFLLHSTDSSVLVIPAPSSAERLDPLFGERRTRSLTAIQQRRAPN